MIIICQVCNQSTVSLNAWVEQLLRPGRGCRLRLSRDDGVEQPSAPQRCGEDVQLSPNIHTLLLFVQYKHSAWLCIITGSRASAWTSSLTHTHTDTDRWDAPSVYWGKQKLSLCQTTAAFNILMSISSSSAGKFLVEEPWEPDRKTTLHPGSSSWVWADKVMICCYKHV